MTPTYKVRHICTICGENVGYLGWIFTVLRIPMLKHKCKEKCGCDEAFEGALK